VARGGARQAGRFGLRRLPAGPRAASAARLAARARAAACRGQQMIDGRLRIEARAAPHVQPVFGKQRPRRHPRLVPCRPHDRTGNLPASSPPSSRRSCANSADDERELVMALTCRPPHFWWLASSVPHGMIIAHVLLPSPPSLIARDLAGAGLSASGTVGCLNRAKPSRWRGVGRERGKGPTGPANCNGHRR
jgi:hypothetical protein